MARPYVSGLTIHDASGNPLRIQGYNIEMRDVGITGGYPEFTQWLKDNGFNSVRAMVWWNNFEPTQGNYSAEYLGYLDALMANCEANGIYVNLCFHQWQYSDNFTYYGVGSGFPKWLLVAGGYDTTATGAKAFISDFWLNQGYGVTARQKYWGWWQFLINRYKNFNCIWAYELFNEPTIISNVSWTSAEYAGIMTFYQTYTPLFRSLESSLGLNPTILIYHYITGTVASQGNLIYEKAVSFPNIAWTRSWYDVAYDGYFPSSEYSQVVSRLTNLKNAFNGQLGTPFVASEMGILRADYDLNTSGGAQWIRDTFDASRNIGMNNGFEGWAWYMYGRGDKHGFTTPRDSSGNNTWMVPAMSPYLQPTQITTYKFSHWSTGQTTNQITVNVP